MEKEQIKYYAETALKQIRCSVHWSVYYSWGISKRFYSLHEGMPTLMLRVSAAFHKGWVYVSYDMGNDTYIIYLYSVRKKLKKKVEDVYCDTLASTIDHLIEHPESLTDEKYAEIALRDSKRKMKAS